MMEIAAAISLATSTFNALKKGMEAGREIEDMMGYYGKWFEAKEALSENAIQNKNQPFVKKLFSGSSVEAQALEITQAKYKIKQMEKELYEYLLYSGQQDFYNDMMKERRVIRQARLQEAQRKAERKTFILNMLALTVSMGIATFVIVGIFVAIIS